MIYVVFIVLIIVVLLFTVSIGVTLMRKNNKKVETSEKMTDDVSILLDNTMDDEII